MLKTKFQQNQSKITFEDFGYFFIHLEKDCLFSF